MPLSDTQNCIYTFTLVPHRETITHVHTTNSVKRKRKDVLLIIIPNGSRDAAVSSVFLKKPYLEFHIPAGRTYLLFHERGRGCSGEAWEKANVHFDFWKLTKWLTAFVTLRSDVIKRPSCNPLDNIDQREIITFFIPAHGKIFHNPPV